ncbi:unnamed protein product [Heligmosomoides polygyrus]|uniref:Peptidase_M13_N domain-containing protein n=1 Tax=Heligmosomoides polygyrus TaxID=6339 RepID=A0A183FGE5_HELPZ|nr:unnamed protein product [Heligmosomoides polygyrus]
MLDDRHHSQAPYIDELLWRQLTEQFRPPDLSQIISPIRADLMRIASPGPTEYEPLLQVQLRQNLTNDPLFWSISPDEKQRQTILDEVSQFMIDVDKISKSITIITTDMTLEEFKTVVPQVNWRDLLAADLSPMLKLTDASAISVTNLEYFKELALLVSRYPPQTVANYLVVVTARNLEKYTLDNLQQPSLLQCAENLETFEPAQKLYIMNNRLYRKDKLMAFLEELKKDFLSGHRSYPLQYVNNINRLAFLAGYPQRLTNEDLVWKPFATVATDFDDYFGTITRLMRKQSSYRLSKIGTYIDSDDTTVYDVLRPTIVYNAHLAVMVLPLALLQSPVAVPGGGTPIYAVYGSLGVAVNHFLAKGDLSHTICLADALKTTSSSFLKWQKNRSVHNEQTIPGFDNYDNAQSMMLVFGTMFCDKDGAESGSQYEAM